MFGVICYINETDMVIDVAYYPEVYKYCYLMQNKNVWVYFYPYYFRC